MSCFALTNKHILQDQLVQLFFFSSLGRPTQYIQKKKTIFPEWNTCFDAHLYEGRVIQMTVMDRPDKMLAESTIPARVLADKCSDGNIATVWVSGTTFNYRARFSLNYARILKIIAVLVTRIKKNMFYDASSDVIK